jgi:hypothetical protein
LLEKFQKSDGSTVPPNPKFQKSDGSTVKALEKFEKPDGSTVTSLERFQKSDGSTVESLFGTRRVRGSSERRHRGRVGDAVRAGARDGSPPQRACWRARTALRR